MDIIDLGLISYAKGLEEQRRVHGEVAEGGEEALILLEHEKVVTLGRFGGRENLLVDEAGLAALGAELVQSSRGGNVTCHFPGQLVAYPIIRVARRSGGLRAVFTNLEKAAIDTLAAFGVYGRSVKERPGVWVGEKKIASIGLAVKRWTTMHGLSLNVGADVSLFSAMNPCGLPEARPTSIALERGDEQVNVSDVKHEFRRNFLRYFPDSLVA